MDNCSGGMHVLGHTCPTCGKVTIPARFWPRDKNGDVSIQHEDVERDYPVALKAYEEWWVENKKEPFAPTPLAYAAGRIRA